MEGSLNIMGSCGCKHNKSYLEQKYDFWFIIQVFI